MRDAVSVERLSFSYGENLVLDELSFSVSEGDFFVIIGPNGSGKTTLLKTISGIIRAAQGDIQVLGRPLRSYSRRGLARAVSFVPQTIPAEFPFTLAELVLMGRAPHLGLLGFEQERDLKMAEDAIAFTELGPLTRRKIDQLSGGERQRAFIARAICQDTSVILLDEPTAALDLSHQTKVMDLMERLQGDRGATVIMVSHDLNLAAMYGNRLLLLKSGKAVSLGAPEQVLTFQTLEKAYGCTLLVDESPLGGVPRVTPVPGRYMGP
jgi:iron complex transport system ATP-binding protein